VNREEYKASRENTIVNCEKYILSPIHKLIVLCNTHDSRLTMYSSRLASY